MYIYRTSKFDRDCKKEKISTIDLGKLEIELSENPERGDVIQGTDGIRKIRMSVAGRGKSGGARVIYFYLKIDNEIYLLSLYKKNTKVELSAKEKKALRVFVKTIKE